ncbi:MAG: response regulator [Acidobacteriota bacterium]
MEAKKILLAEDSENDVALTLAALDEHKLANEVVVARDGVEAIDYLRRQGRFSGQPNGNPVVVLLDLKMPRKDGLEVLSEIRSDPNLKHIPVVALTSSREEQDIVRSYELSVNAYVVKPVAFEKLVDVVKQLGLFWVLINQPPPDGRGTSISS